MHVAIVDDRDIRDEGERPVEYLFDHTVMPVRLVHGRHEEYDFQAMPSPNGSRKFSGSSMQKSQPRPIAMTE